MIAAMFVAFAQIAAAKVGPESHAVTQEDALWSIPDVTGRIVRVADSNGDGADDYAIQRGGDRSSPKRIDLVSSRDGTPIRTLYNRGPRELFPTAWDAGGDLDRDGVPDLVVGLGRSADGAGRVIAISGRTARILFELVGTVPDERLGTAVAFIGDVNCDGFDDFVVGAPSADLDDGKGQFVNAYGPFDSFHDDDPSNDALPEMVAKWLASRSEQTGFVSMRSGLGGGELWRLCGSMCGGGFGACVRGSHDMNGDGVPDAMLFHDDLAHRPATFVSGRNGETLAKHALLDNTTCGGGDVDKDGHVDVVCTRKGIRLHSALTGRLLYELPPIDWVYSSYASATIIEDIDGDGCADVALGEPNFNLRGHPGNEAWSTTPPEHKNVRALSLKAALKLETKSWHMGPEAGTVVIYSGRTRQPIFGAWGAYGTEPAIGFQVLTTPDANGDGVPDLLVRGKDRAYVFASPARRADAK